MICDLSFGAFAKFRKATISFIVAASPPSPSACKNLIPTEQIFMKFDIWKFFEDLWNLIRVAGILMKTYVNLWQYLAEFLLEWEMFQAKVVQKIKTHILCSYMNTWNNYSCQSNPSCQNLGFAKRLHIPFFRGAAANPNTVSSSLSPGWLHRQREIRNYVWLVQVCSTLNVVRATSAKLDRHMKLGIQNRKMNKYRKTTYTYNYSPVFSTTSCNQNIKIIIRKIYKNAIQKLD